MCKTGRAEITEISQRKLKAVFVPHGARADCGAVRGSELNADRTPTGVCAFVTSSVRRHYEDGDGDGDSDVPMGMCD